MLKGINQNVEIGINSLHDRKFSWFKIELKRQLDDDVGASKKDDGMCFVTVSSHFCIMVIRVNGAAPSHHQFL